MGNFTGSYHWKTLSDFVTRIFTAANDAARLALLTAGIPNRAMPGDICIQTDMANQWFMLGPLSTPPIIGDWDPITPWEASLIGINAIAQFPGDTTIQLVLDDALSGDTGGVGNPFDIITTAGFGIGAGVAAPAAGNVEAVVDVIAGTDVLAVAGGVGAGVAVPAAGNVEAAAQVIAGTGVTATTGGILVSAGDIATVAGAIKAGARIVGVGGLQAGVTVGDFVITRLRNGVVNLAGNGALAAHTQAEETLAAPGVMPGTAVIIGLQPSAAMVAGCVLCPGRNAGGGNVVIRYINCTAAPIVVAADAAFGVLWMDTVVI